MAPPNASLQPRQCSDDSLLMITPDDDSSMYQSNSHRSPSFTTSTPKGTQTSNMRRIHCEECDSEELLSSSKRACLDDSLYLYNEDTNQLVSTLELVSNQCCRNDCLKSFPENIIEQAQLKFAARTISEQNQFLLTCFELSIGNSKKMTHVLEGQSLCNNAFKLILCMSDKRYKRIYQQYRKGVINFEPKKRSRKESEKVSDAKAWMEQYFNMIGDHMPHLEKNSLASFFDEARHIFQNES